MHEMSICESLMQIIEDQAQAQGFDKVDRVRLEIGRFAGVEVDALRFGFSVVTAKTLAADAALEIVDLPGRVWCFDCGETHDVESRTDDCPACAGRMLQPVGGEELRLKDLEVR